MDGWGQGLTVGSARQAWARTLRAVRGRALWLSQRLPDRPAEDGGGVGEVLTPQLRDTAEPFVSAVRENLAGRTEALEDLAVELFARGLSTRDIEAAFTDTDGRRLVSRYWYSSPISRRENIVRRNETSNW